MHCVSYGFLAEHCFPLTSFPFIHHIFNSDVEILPSNDEFDLGLDYGDYDEEDEDVVDPDQHISSQLSDNIPNQLLANPDDSYDDNFDLR